jgi:hypothetical protein
MEGSATRKPTIVAVAVVVGVVLEESLWVDNEGM